MKSFGLCRQIIRTSFVNSKTVNDKCLKRNLDLHLKVVICNIKFRKQLIIEIFYYIFFHFYNCNHISMELGTAIVTKKWEMSNLKYKLFLIFPSKIITIVTKS